MIINYYYFSSSLLNVRSHLETYSDFFTGLLTYECINTCQSWNELIYKAINLEHWILKLSVKLYSSMLFSNLKQWFLKVHAKMFNSLLSLVHDLWYTNVNFDIQFIRSLCRMLICINYWMKWNNSLIIKNIHILTEQKNIKQTFKKNCSQT